MLRKEKWFKTVDGTKWTMDGTNFKGWFTKGLVWLNMDCSTGAFYVKRKFIENLVSYPGLQRRTDYRKSSKQSPNAAIRRSRDYRRR